MNKLEKLNKETIELLIEHDLLIHLIRKELTKELLENVKIEEEVIINIKNSIMKKEGLNSDNEFNSWLDNSNITKEKFFEKIIFPMKLNKYVLDKFNHMVNARFLQRKEELDVVTYSLIRVKDRYLAQELYFKILDDESKFGELASEHSIGQEKLTKGIVGPISIDKGHSILKEKLKNSPIGKIQTPILIDNVWVIIRVESKQDSSLNEETELLMAKEIFDEHLSKEASNTLNKMRDKNSLVEV